VTQEGTEVRDLEETELRGWKPWTKRHKRRRAQRYFRIYSQRNWLNKAPLNPEQWEARQACLASGEKTPE
jgi:hypothetical protein